MLHLSWCSWKFWHAIGSSTAVASFLKSLLLQCCCLYSDQALVKLAGLLYISLQLSQSLNCIAGLLHNFAELVRLTCPLAVKLWLPSVIYTFHRLWNLTLNDAERLQNFGHPLGVNTVIAQYSRLCPKWTLCNLHAEWLCHSVSIIFGSMALPEPLDCGTAFLKYVTVSHHMRSL